jgi:glycosyltransferase involved in cell wall biosynthesis
MTAVSVVIPVRNRQQWIARAIESALAQTVPPSEVIVVDDGSTDGTVDVVRRYDVRLLRRDGGGAYAARNEAIRAARAPLIAFLDSDDVWLPHKLERQLPRFGDPQVGVVFGDARIGRGSAFANMPPGHATRRDFVRGNFIAFSTAVVRRECFETCGFFDERLSADYLAFFRIAARYRLAYVPEIVVEYTLHDANWSGDLEASLRSRMALFGEELARATSAEERAMIEQILFNLRLSFRIATGAAAPAIAAGPSRIRWAAAFFAARFAREWRRWARR